jgi:hypothetical protein
MNPTVPILMCASLLGGWIIGHGAVIARASQSGDEYYLMQIESKVAALADDVHSLVHGNNGSSTGSYQITEVDPKNAYGRVDASKDIKGFSCVADVDGNDGRVDSTIKCYILSK